jgi:hypothetical protein
LISNFIYSFYKASLFYSDDKEQLSLFKKKHLLEKLNKNRTNSNFKFIKKNKPTTSNTTSNNDTLLLNEQLDSSNTIKLTKSYVRLFERDQSLFSQPVSNDLNESSKSKKEMILNNKCKNLSISEFELKNNKNASSVINSRRNSNISLISKLASGSNQTSISLEHISTKLPYNYLITIDTSKARSNLEVLKMCISELGWQECPEGLASGCDIIWQSCTSHEGRDQFVNATQSATSRVNKFPCKFSLYLFS